MAKLVGVMLPQIPSVLVEDVHDSPLHPLLKTLPHAAFKVNDLTAAIAGEEVILEPYEPIDDYFVAVITVALPHRLALSPRMMTFLSQVF